jgi:hypothetical protein
VRRSRATAGPSSRSRSTTTPHRSAKGTKVVVRAASLSGVANRYVDLQFPPGSPRAIPDGGRLPTASATSAVDLDQVLNLFGRRQRQALAGVIEGSGQTLRGATADARTGSAPPGSRAAGHQSLCGRAGG